MKKNPQKKHYLKVVEWSAEDGCYVGTCPELMFGGVHGDDEISVYKQLQKAVQEVIALKTKHGDKLPEPIFNKSFSGKFVLRLKPELHKVLAIRALEKHASLNEYCTGVLEKVAM